MPDLRREHFLRSAFACTLHDTSHNENKIRDPDRHSSAPGDNKRSVS